MLCKCSTTWLRGEAETITIIMMRHDVQVYRDNVIGYQKCKETRTNGANNLNLNLILLLRLCIKLPLVEDKSELTVPIPLQKAK